MRRERGNVGVLITDGLTRLARHASGLALFQQAVDAEDAVEIDADEDAPTFFLL